MATTDTHPMSAEEKKVIFASSLGTVFEWYDFYLYGSLAAIIAKQFFSGLDEGSAFIFALLAFAAGFIVRPFGAIFFGRLGDMIGRKYTFLVTILIMGISTFIVGLLPNYASIGVAAPVILICLRLLQGLALGGEYGGAATYVAEHAPHGKRGAFTSWIQTTATLGLFLSLMVILGVRTYTGEEAFADWGWRIPFFVGAALAVVVFWLRRRLDETSAFIATDASEAPKSSALLLILKHPKEALMVIGLTAGGTIAFYTYTTYLQKFLVNTSGFSKATATEVSAAALFVFMLLQPAVGALSDRVGRRPVMIAFGIAGVLFTVPIMTALSGVESPFMAFLLAMAALIIVSGYTAINAVVKAELFPAHIRTLGVALPYAIANAAFGGTAEYAALWFKGEGMESVYFWYVTALIGVSLLTYVRMRDTGRNSLIIHD